MNSTVLQNIDEKGKVISKDIFHHIRHHLITSKEEWFISNESDLSKNKLELVEEIKMINVHTIELMIKTEISTWWLRNQDYVNNEMETMIKNEFKIVDEDLRIQDSLFGSIDDCPTYHGEVTIAFSAFWGLSPPVSHYMFRLFDMPKLLYLIPGLLLIPSEFYRQMKIMFKSVNERKTMYVDNLCNSLVTEKYIYQLMQSVLQPLKDKVKDICEIDVPRILRADKMFIDNALKQRSSLKEVINKYRPLQYQCEMLLGKIEILLVGYFPNIKLSFPYISEAKFEHAIGKGSFSIVQSATISINNVDTIVAVKTLQTPLDDIYSYKQLSEALILR